MTSRDEQITGLTNALSLMGDGNEYIREARGIINNVIRSIKVDRLLRMRCKSMKLKIYEEKEKKEDKTVRLKLKDDEDGDISLIAVDKDGDEMIAGTLLVMQDDGTLYLNEDINEDLGFKLDKDGRIKVDIE